MALVCCVPGALVAVLSAVFGQNTCFGLGAGWPAKSCRDLFVVVDIVGLMSG